MAWPFENNFGQEIRMLIALNIPTAHFQTRQQVSSHLKQIVQGIAEILSTAPSCHFGVLHILGAQTLLGGTQNQRPPHQLEEWRKPCFNSSRSSSCVSSLFICAVMFSFSCSVSYFPRLLLSTCIR
eukprot:TRINITY_DN2074_c0_g1_i2.p1 TRINITY_DN2074_c0_g1~~TRINITY_DN2074_c0_g1_i2.p1  ORF type:complete len:126 (-),score=23.46 TRINITY_DN2074_c0_g1_i2:168-545(-)